MGSARIYASIRRASEPCTTQAASPELAAPVPRGERGAIYRGSDANSRSRRHCHAIEGGRLSVVLAKYLKPSKIHYEGAIKTLNAGV